MPRVGQRSLTYSRIAGVAMAVCLIGIAPTSTQARATHRPRPKPAPKPAPKPPPAPPPVYVFPVPGSHFASPTTQITFRGLPADRLGTITVTGSVSGPHTGTVQADSDGDGGSFIPSTPFTAGELVTVSTSLNLDGYRSGAYQFQVAMPAGQVPFAYRPAAPRVPGDVWWYRTQPTLTPAAVTITKTDPGATGDIFVAPQVGPLQQGPEIIGPNGGLVWFDPLPPNEAATDFRVQSYQGRPALTWWQGNESAGVGVGQDIIMSSSYQVVKTISAGNGLSADLHEFQLTPSGTALITAEYPVYVDATAMHGVANEVVLDSVVQEIDIPTGLVLFQWDSLDHVPITGAYTLPPNAPKKKGKAPLPNGVWDPYDYFHVNSVSLDRDGNLLISGRNTWAVYKVSHDTGSVIWSLGGKWSYFRPGPGASFAFQHDVRVRAAGDQILTMFDDGAGPPYVHSQSRALTLRLNFKRRTATVISQLGHSPPLLSSYEGDDQELPDADNFIGWGEQPYFSQYNDKGKLVFDGRFVDENISYRAYRFVWNGTPTTPPAVVALSHGRKMTVWASWNGATGVRYWRALGGPSPSALRPVATTAGQGFETAMKAHATQWVQVVALGAKGRPLARSAVVQVGG